MTQIAQSGLLGSDPICCEVENQGPRELLLGLDKDP
jgi:hypothetical protein